MAKILTKQKSDLYQCLFVRCLFGHCARTCLFGTCNGRDIDEAKERFVSERMLSRQFCYCSTVVTFTVDIFSTDYSEYHFVKMIVLY